MKSVYEHLDTGDFYYVADGDLGRNVNLQGERQYSLAVPRQVLSESGNPMGEVQGHWPHQVLAENFALRLVVSGAEFDSKFRLREDLKAVVNGPIEQLLAEYTAEDCDFTDLEWVARVARRNADTDGDGLSRCLLHTLAVHVAKAAPANS